MATWNDFRQDKRRYNFADREISRKPHADTVERIRDNDRRRKEIDRMDRGRIERDLQQVKVGRDMPTRTDIRSPITTSKIVDADKRSTPLDRGSLPTRNSSPRSVNGPSARTVVPDLMQTVPLSVGRRAVIVLTAAHPPKKRANNICAPPGIDRSRKPVIREPGDSSPAGDAARAA